LKFKRFLLIKTEGKGEGEFYRIPVAPLLLLFLFFLALLIGGSIWLGSERSPLVIRREKLKTLKAENRALDSIIQSLKTQIDTTNIDSRKINRQAEKLREKASLPPEKFESKPGKAVPLSHAFLQSYSDTLFQFLRRSVDSAEVTLWHSLPTISPLPLAIAVQTIGYGIEFDSFSGVKRRNSGITFAAPLGTAVVATASGSVYRVYRNGANGLTVELAHAHRVTTRYSHLGRAAVAKGKRIKKGEQIGTVGETGWSVGPQLLYEITKNGKPVDPTLLVQEGI